MLGPEGAVELVRAYLAATMPDKITALQAALGVDATELRPPASYNPSQYERLELAQYPAVEVQIQDVGKPTFLDNAGDAVTWRVPYTIRVYTIERGYGFDQVEQRRKRLFRGVYELLASRVALASDPPAWVDVTSLSGNFFGLGILDSQKDSRAIAATYIEFDLIVEEMTDVAPPLGTVDTVEVTVHPAML